MDTITLIFTSTVVSAIVTALFGFFSSKRQNTLKYITEERENGVTRCALLQRTLNNLKLTI